MKLAIRLAGYLFDQPNAGRGVKSFANAGRNSGAWAIFCRSGAPGRKSTSESHCGGARGRRHDRQSSYGCFG